VTENPNDPNVHSAMAMLQDRLGHPEKADKEFKAALSLGPRSPDVLNNYAIYLCRNGRVDEGVKSFEEAAHNALYRTPEAAYTNAGVCLRGA
jgi:type IV pilus assembly protein PilF